MAVYVWSSEEKIRDEVLNAYKAWIKKLINQRLMFSEEVENNFRWKILFLNPSKGRLFQRNSATRGDRYWSHFSCSKLFAGRVELHWKND